MVLTDSSRQCSSAELLEKSVVIPTLAPDMLMHFKKGGLLYFSPYVNPTDASFGTVNVITVSSWRG